MFVTTENIFKNIWNLEYFVKKIDTGADWDYTRIPTPNDINYWECIYFVPGSIGVYAAHDPYIEYYLIFHNLFSKYETFYGINAATRCKEKLQEYGINLEPNIAWSNLHQMH